MVLTPVVDPGHASWELQPTTAGWLDDYKAEAWREYWSRAWCRVEAMLGAAYPVTDAEQRAALFRGGLRTALLAGRRPHLLYGSKEVAENKPPKFLPPLLHGTFAKYKPEDGALTKPEQDKPTIVELSRKAREQWPELKVGFDPAYEYRGGAGGGRGTKVVGDGSV